MIPLSPRGRKPNRRHPPPMPVQKSTHTPLMDDLGSFTVDDSQWEWFPCTAKEFEWERDWSISDEVFHTRNHESNLDVNDTRNAAPTADFPFTANDVLLGRGGFTNLHEGNVRFRTLAAQLRSAYKATRSNEMKRQISLRLVPMVQSNGARFMKKNDNGNYMEVDVDDENVVNKLMQAIREDPAAARERRDRSRDEQRHLRQMT